MSALAAALLVALVAARGDGAVPRARVTVDGPADGVVLDCGAAGATRLVGEVRAGERRTLEVPLAADPRLVPPTVRAPGAAPDAGGPSVRVEPLPTAEPPVDAALRRRGRPPVGARDARPAGSSLLLVAAALVVAGRTRARPRVALAVGLGAAVLVAALPPLAPGGAASVRVYEADGRSGRWLVAQSSAEAAPLPGGPDAAGALVLEIEPAGARREWTVDLGATPPAWRVAAPGARVTLLADHAPGSRRLELALNAWASLDAVWVRSREGAWSARGAWPLGEALPVPGAGGPHGSPAATGPRGEVPPGWLASGLPPGLEVVLARLAPGRAPDVPGLGTAEVAWLRWVEPPAPGSGDSRPDGD